MMTEFTPRSLALPDGMLPWTRSCFVCGEANPHGLKLRSHVEKGVVCIDYVPRDSDRGWATIMHGGIGMTLLDEAMTWAAILQCGKACVAAELTIRMTRPTDVQRPIRVEATVAAARARLIRTTGRILDENGDVLSSATGKYAPMRAEDAELCADDFVASTDAIPLDTILGAAGRRRP